MFGRVIRRRIKRGKKKSYTISDTNAFMAMLNDIFDVDSPEDEEGGVEGGEEVQESGEINEAVGDDLSESPIDEMFTELKEIKDLNNALAQFSLALYERVVLGSCGTLIGTPRPGAPVSYSILAAPEDQVVEFCQAFTKLSQRYQTLRNQADIVFCKMLTQLLLLPSQLQERLTVIIGHFVKMKMYGRSKKDDFFLSALTKENNSVEILSKTILGLEKVLGPQETFQFCKENGFLAAMKHQDFGCEQFLTNCQEFNKYLQEEEKQLMLKQQEEDIFKAFKESPNEVNKLIAEAKANIYENENQWLKFLIDIAMQAIDLRESDLERAIQPFKQIKEELAQALNSVVAQGAFMDFLQAASYSQNFIPFFRQILFYMHKEQLIDGNVIIAWYDRAQGRGKVTLGAQIQKFVAWLKAD